MIAPQVNGYTKELGQRVPYDLEKAKALMKEAGYDNNFEVTLDCPNNRYINDEAICQAVVAMWAKIGVKAKLNAMPRATFFPKVGSNDTSIYLFGWGVPTFDAYYSLEALIHSKGEGANGSFNYGNYSNPQVDKLIDTIKTETNDAKRTEMIHEALALFAKDFGAIPLHDQIIPWAMKKNVTVLHRADNRPVVEWIKID
jgi:peptide/nickel transport system substrate-binding protein